MDAFEVQIDQIHSNPIKADFAFSISSFEHDGLGRYGDPLDPEGDLRAMRDLHKLMAEEGILFLAVPVGPDCLVWNAHRIYGPLRLPKLLKNWGFLGSYGFMPTTYVFTRSPGYLCQPVLVLSANKNALHIPDSATDIQKHWINAISRSGSFDPDWYIETYPDILSGQMDPLSHYVIYGHKEMRRPTSWFDAHKYCMEHPEIDWESANPFVEFLGLN